MRKIAKYLFVAVMAAFTFASCEKEKDNPLLNPSGTPVKFAFSATATSETTADLKVVSDVPAPADVTISLAAATDNNMTGMTFPTELILKKGETEITGKLSVDKDALTPEVKYKAVIVASVAGVPLGTLTVLSITVPKPAPVTVDGDASEWAKLPGDYVTELVCSEDAELKGLKSAKVFYDDKLYALLEVTDEALAQGVTDGKLRMHFYFDNGNDADTGYKGKIDCMLEGKMTSGGEWCALSSNYYKWTGEDPEKWSGSWTSAEVVPTFTFAGKGNLYECAMDYSTYPGTLKEVIGIGFDIQDGGYTTVGYLPSKGVVEQVVKNGAKIPAPAEVEFAIDGDFSEWKTVESIAGDGAIKALKMKNTDDKMFFYLEVVKTDDVKLDATMAFAHKIMLCFDNGDNEGSFGNEAWGGAKYDKIVDIWLMQNGVPNMITWSVDNFEHKEVDGDVQKYEFCFPKSADAIFSGNSILYGAYITNQTVDTSSGSEVWDGEDTSRIGSAPAVNHPMAYNGEVPTPVIDGDLSEWVAFDGICNGAYGMFKAASDDKNLYFYTYRTTEGRYSAIWGGSGYLYIAFNLDGDETNGVTLNSNGPYDFIGFFLPYFGTLEAPEIKENCGEGGDSLPEPYNLLGMKCKGVVNDKGAYIEYSIPRSNLPTIPNTPITITTWGNKDMNKVIFTCTL